MKKQVLTGMIQGKPLLWACTWHGGQRKHIIINNLPEVVEPYNLSGKN